MTMLCLTFILINSTSTPLTSKVGHGMLWLSAFLPGKSIRQLKTFPTSHTYVGRCGSLLVDAQQLYMLRKRAASFPESHGEELNITPSTFTDPKSSFKIEQMLFSTASFMFSFVRGSNVKSWQEHWARIWIEQWCKPICKLEEKRIVTSSTVPSPKRSSSTWHTT